MKVTENFYVQLHSNNHNEMMESSFSSRQKALNAALNYVKDSATIFDYFVIGKATLTGDIKWEKGKLLFADQILTKGQALKLKRIESLGVKYRILVSDSCFFVKASKNIISIKSNDLVFNKDMKQIYPSDQFKRFNRFLCSAKQK